MGFSLIVRLLVNVPQLGGSPSALMNWVALGFALIGIMLFWFVESFYPIDRRVRLAANLAGVAIYAAFLALLWNNAIVTDVRRGSDGGIDFGITTAATALSAFHYLYEGLALFLLIRNAAWRRHRSLLVGTAIVTATSVAAVLTPAVSLQTYTIAFGTLFRKTTRPFTYSVVLRAA